MALTFVVTGATGFVGQKLCLEIIKRGHSLRVVGRDVAQARKTIPLPAHFYSWSGTQEFPKAALSGAHVVIHLAGENIAAKRWSVERKANIINSRVQGTASLVKALNEVTDGPRVLVGASAVGFYGDRGDEPLNEESSFGMGFLSDVCRAWEGAYEPFKGRLAILRTAVVLGHGSALEKMLPPFRMGVAGRLGSGKQWMSWIHIDDLVKLYLAAAENEAMRGIYNACAPECITNNQFTKSMGRALYRPTIFPLPVLALKIIFGEMSHVLLDSQRVSPKRTLESGFKFTYPTIDQALTDLLVPRGERGAYVKEAYQWIPRPLSEVFPFFSEAKNLERITPEWLNFHIVDMSTDKIQEGSLINYRLKIKGVPTRWRTRISTWQPPYEFVDEQLKGPYDLWHHTHRFQEVAGGTLMTDRIVYRPPLGPLGTIAREIMIKNDVDTIFGHRLKTVETYFK